MIYITESLFFLEKQWFKIEVTYIYKVLRLSYLLFKKKKKDSKV